MRWPKYWSFSFSISPSKEHPGLISFTMGWGQEEKEMTEDEMAGWHHRLDGYEFG